jgi:GDP-L-fucose synthase
MDRDSTIYIAGHTGLVGSAIDRRLREAGYLHVVTRSHAELDLTDQQPVHDFFREVRPSYVFLTAGRVGGIRANSAYPAEFIHTNLAIELNVLHAAYSYGVARLLFFGSSCVYPALAPQPMREEYLLSGALEPSSQPYAIAKLAGMTMCAAYNAQHGTCFIPVIPPTIYGPNDSFDEDGHVLSALLARFAEAKRAARHKGQGATGVTIWGTGEARREFLFVDDLADVCLLLMCLSEEMLRSLVLPESFMNLGVGEDIAIRDLVALIAETVRYDGPIVFDGTKPDGVSRKLLDRRKSDRLGWRPKVSLADGLRRTYEWYEQRHG